MDVRKNTKEKYIEEVVIKTIAGFVILLVVVVGVADNGEINGIDEEIEKFHKSDDKFLLHFKNIFKKNCGKFLTLY